MNCVGRRPRSWLGCPISRPHQQLALCARRRPHKLYMRVVLFVLGLLPASGGFQLLADRGLQRVGSAIEGANRALDNQEEKQVAFAKSISDFISRTRQSVFDSNPFRAMGEFPLAPPEYFLVDDVAALRNSLRMILQEERIIGLFLLGTCTLLAVVGGTTAGQHSSLPGRAQKDDQDLAFRKTLSSEAAAAFDAGRSPQAVETLQTRSELLRRAGNRGDRDVTVIMWLELALCILLDAAGDASFFYPIGEIWDVPFALFSALVVELLFGWPALAAVAFWEELLPFTDILPTATLGWLLVVILGLRPTEPAPAAFLVGRLDPELFAPGARPPTSDSRSFTPPEPWLDSKKRGSWED